MLTRAVGATLRLYGSFRHPLLQPLSKEPNPRVPRAIQAPRKLSCGTNFGCIHSLILFGSRPRGSFQMASFYSLCIHVQDPMTLESTRGVCLILTQLVVRGPPSQLAAGIARFPFAPGPLAEPYSRCTGSEAGAPSRSRSGERGSSTLG